MPKTIPTIPMIYSKQLILEIYPIEIPISKDYTETLLAVQATFNYQINNDQHRRWLNALVDCGIGNRNPYGLGFVNITDKQHPINNIEM